jgi:signal transduction histidine kinase
LENPGAGILRAGTAGAGFADGAAYSRWKRRAQRHPLAVDAIVVMLLVVVSVGGAALSAPGAPAPSRPSEADAIYVACLALFGHRRFPRTTAVVVIACTIALAARGYVLTPLLLAPIMAALFLLPIRAGRRATCLLTLAAVAGVTCTALVAGPAAESIGLKVLGPQAWLLLPGLAGLAASSRAQYEARARDEEARHRVAEERMRIARELHDVVAHHLALANAQAGTVAHLIGADPGRAKVMAADMAGTIGSALRELKATVGLLREAVDPDTPLEPAPGLARLPGLSSSFAAAGLTVDATTTGAARPLSPAVDLTAFRVIQEALTNVTKHATVRRASVRLAYGNRLLTITVTNEAGSGMPVAPGAGPGPAGPGYGLTGMHERAASVGGRLRAGPRPGGGFEVIAELPVELPPRGGQDGQPKEEEAR